MLRGYSLDMNFQTESCENLLGLVETLIQQTGVRYLDLWRNYWKLLFEDDPEFIRQPEEDWPVKYT